MAYADGISDVAALMLLGQMSPKRAFANELLISLLGTFKNCEKRALGPMVLPSPESG